MLNNRRSTIRKTEHVTTISVLCNLSFFYYQMYVEVVSPVKGKLHERLPLNMRGHPKICIVVCSSRSINQLEIRLSRFEAPRKIFKSSYKQLFLKVINRKKFPNSAFDKLVLFSFVICALLFTSNCIDNLYKKKTKIRSNNKGLNFESWEVLTVNNRESSFYVPYCLL